MKKTLLTLMLMNTLHAITYEALREQALQNNPSLQINKTKVQQYQLQGELKTRLANPTVEFEVADFSAKRLLGQKDFGARVGVSQSLLLPAFKKDTQALTLTQVALAKENLTLEKATFGYRFDLYYLAYKKAKAQELLAQEALDISAEIVQVAKGRFEGGSVAKSEYLQAKIEHHAMQSRLNKLQLLTLQRRDELLRFCNVANIMEIESNKAFFISEKSAEHPLLKVTKKQQEIAQSKLKVASHTIESYALFSEIEAEPEQDTFRIGISMALPVFNEKSQEKQLAKIALNNQRLVYSTQEKALSLELSQLHNENLAQASSKERYEALVREQEGLLAMYQEGYALAKVNLLKLSMLKQTLLNSKEMLLNTDFALEENSIKINYLQGAYNE